MDENTNFEVSTEFDGSGEVSTETEITIEESSGPSKTFVALVAGGIAAAVVGTVIAVKKFKKRKAKKKAAETEILEDDDCEGDFETDYDEDVEDAEVLEPEKESKKK